MISYMAFEILKPPFKGNFIYRSEVSSDVTHVVTNSFTKL
jgi:hypothetical protein